MQAMFRDFILACKDNSKYSNMNARNMQRWHWIKIEVVILVMREFLELTKSLFSTFDLVRA
jgi:hypothetical protein